jgi:hypothetical protein
MMNETQKVPMPGLLPDGPEGMLERATKIGASGTVEGGARCPSADRLRTVLVGKHGQR